MGKLRFERETPKRFVKKIPVTKSFWHVKNQNIMIFVVYISI